MILIVVLSGSYFVVVSLRSSAETPKAGVAPAIDEAPARVYGVVEPLGREVFVSPPVARRIVEVSVREGDEAKRGQLLCVLEHDTEEKTLAVTHAAVVEARKKLALSEETLRRNKNLYEQGLLPQSEYRDSELRVDYEREQLRVAEAQAAVEAARLEELYLRSPIDGVVYKFDVRLGETLTPTDNSRIVLGLPERQVRLFVEVFWQGRISVSARYEIRNAEDGERLGTGTVVSIAPYVGRRDFRTEDSQERFDTKYQQVVLELDTGGLPKPRIGLAVMAELLR